jgi:hypothetical protein
LPFTILLALVFFYWMLIIVGFLGLDSFDFDMGADADVDVDVDLDADVDADVDVGSAADSAGGGLTAVGMLRFFNVGHVPLMVVLSVFITSLWAVSVLANYYFNPTLAALISLALLVPNILLSLLVVKIITTPLKYLMKHVNAGIEQSIRIVGKTCIVRTLHVTSEVGQAEVVGDSRSLLINVRTRSGEELAKGDEALVVERLPDRDAYVVVKFDLNQPVV